MNIKKTKKILTKISPFFKKHRGFTLIEVLIATALLAFLSIYTTQSITQSLKNKKNLQDKTSKFERIRQALFLMEREISLALNSFNINTYTENLALNKVCNKLNKKRKKAPDLIKKIKFIKHYSVFLGKEKSLFFLSASHTRTRVNEKSSKLVFIKYSLDSCAQSDKKCLWKIASDDYRQESIKEKWVLLEDVEDISFQYLGSQTDYEWKSEWESQESLKTVKKLPDAVEIVISHKNKDKEEKFIAITPIHHSKAFSSFVPMFACANNIKIQEKKKR